MSPVKFTELPNEMLMQINKHLDLKSSTNLCMVLNKDLSGYCNELTQFRKYDDDMEVNWCYHNNGIKLFGHMFCRDICERCMLAMPDGFCYLKMLVRRRLQVMVSLGSYPTIRQIVKMRTSLKNACIDDLFISYTKTPENVSDLIPSLYKGKDQSDANRLYKPVTIHVSRQRYSYGESEFEKVFSPEEISMFRGDASNEETIDDELQELIDQEENSPYHDSYYIMGSDIVNKLDAERDILSSGYTAIEEACIINNFKRRVDLGIPIDEAMKSSIGLDVWTMRRQGMSGVKRFIESRICDIARSYGKKPRRKLNMPQMELLKRADEAVLDEIIYDKEIKAKSLKDSITRASLASVDSEKLKQVTSNVRIVKNKKSLDAESFCSLSDMGRVINDIASKVGDDLDKICEHNKMDSRLDDMLLKAEKVQTIYDELISHGSEKKDPLILKRSIESIHNVYENLIKDEMESLEKYGNITSDLQEEYKKGLMFDSTPELLRDSDKLQKMNQLIDEFGDDKIKTKMHTPIIEPVKEKTIEEDLSELSDSVPDRLSFTVKKEEPDLNEEKIVECVEDLMTRRYNQRPMEDSNIKSITKDECLNLLCKDFGIKAVSEHKDLNRTKKEVFLYMYRRVMYIFGFDVTLKYPEDPAKSEYYFRIFNKFYIKNLQYKNILRTQNSSTVEFWKMLFAGDNNKDVYKIPEAPPSRIYVEDPVKTKEIYEERVRNYELGIQKEADRKVEIKNIEEKIEKIQQKLKKAEKAEIPKGFKMQAINKILNDYHKLKEQLNEAKRPVAYSTPYYETIYKEVPNPEYLEHMQKWVKGSRSELIALGWLKPRLNLSAESITDRIIHSMEDQSLYDRKYRVRLALDNKNMLVETDGNDFWQKIYVIERSNLQKNADDFLQKTVEMFFDMIDRGMSGKTSKLIRYLCSGQETRILCAMMSYYSYGYISKKFIPLRKKHRREICSLLDKLIK